MSISGCGGECAYWLTPLLGVIPVGAPAPRDEVLWHAAQSPSAALKTTASPRHPSQARGPLPVTARRAGILPTPFLPAGRAILPVRAPTVSASMATARPGGR